MAEAYDVRTPIPNPINGPKHGIRSIERLLRSNFSQISDFNDIEPRRTDASPASRVDKSDNVDDNLFIVASDYNTVKGLFSNMTFPPHSAFNAQSITPLPSHPRTSISSSFSFDPQPLVNSLNEANNSYSSAGSSHRQSIGLDPNRSILTASPLRSSPRTNRRAKEGQSRHPLAQDNTNVFQDDDIDKYEDDDDDMEWTMVDRMRLWRHDAMMQHLYDTAAFWGDKILSFTNDPNDAFWLAQIYFMTNQYTRSERLLTRPFKTPSDESSMPIRPLHASTNGHPHLQTDIPPMFPTNPMHHLHEKGKGKETLNPLTAVTGLGLGGRLPMGAGAMFDLAADRVTGVSRLVDMSVACRYLAAQCLVRQGKWADATEMLGEYNPFRGNGRSGPKIPNVDGGIKIEASMCHLRGLLMLKLNRGETAKECFMEALILDVKCYEAFQQLINGEMLTVDEEWNFIQSLAYLDQTPEDAEFIRLIYSSRLRKYKHAEEHAQIRRRLTEEFGLNDNPDVLHSFADALYAQFRWADCFAITSRILELVSVHTPTMPLHIACMHHLPHLHSKLFILAHELVDKEPEAAMSWYAVGVWYLTSKRWGDARTYFSKASLMDPRFAPAWIAFAHTFALEGEHDHAITAYSTCARLFVGSHLPLMFIGMEQILLSNYPMADEALNAARQLCDNDPLLTNERGVMAFNHGRFNEAIALFEEAISFRKSTQGSQSVWATTYINLGTALQKAGRLPEARDAYRKVTELEPRHSTALAYLGKVCHLLDDLDAAIVKYHESLSIDPVNGHVIELLNLALDANAEKSLPFPKSISAADEKALKQEMSKSWERDRLIKEAGAKSRSTIPSWRDDMMNIE